MRLKQLIIAMPLTVLIATGCSSYPQPGRGGMAEQYLSAEFSPVLPDEPLGPEHGLRFDWQIAKLHLDMLVKEGAQSCFPASVLQLSVRQQRIARELDGGLQLDAANDIIIQRKALGKLEQQLDYVTSQAQCIPQATQSAATLAHVDVVKELVNLLNSDNQFAHNSAEVSPKYMGRLAKAAQLLNHHSNLTLSITGHADADGAAAYNETLALERANQVKRYLAIFGLNLERITTLALGETLPLFKGTTPGVKLTNRRVTVEVNSDAASLSSPTTKAN